MRILVVEDDPKLGAQIVQTLQSVGHEVEWLSDGDLALAHSDDGYDLVLLDLMLPGAYGLDILKHLRSRSDVPILILSAKQEAAVRVRALELGADDYLTKPFWPAELLARVQARLRRPALSRGQGVRLGSLEVDLESRRVHVAGVEVMLTKVEFDLLAVLARRPGAAVERDWLAMQVLDPEREGTARTLDVHVSRLRKKLGTAGACLRTVWGVGYRLESGEDA